MREHEGTREANGFFTLEGWQFAIEAGRQILFDLPQRAVDHIVIVEQPFRRLAGFGPSLGACQASRTQPLEDGIGSRASGNLLRCLRGYPVLLGKLDCSMIERREIAINVRHQLANSVSAARASNMKPERPGLANGIRRSGWTMNVGQGALFARAPATLP